jgi:hypothetical protein
MPRKARIGSGNSGPYNIICERIRSTTGEQWRCRMVGFKAPFFGATPRAAVLQAGQAIESHLEQRLTVATTSTTTRGRKATVRTKTRGRRQMAESVL